MRPVLVCLLVLPAVSGLAQDFGPITTRNHRAIDLPFLRFDPMAGLVPEGHAEWDYSLTSANDSRSLPRPGPATVIEDQETERAFVRYRKGLSNGREISFEVPYVYRWGGFLDAMIFDWHKDVLHWQDSFRASQPFGQCIVQVPGSRYGAANGLGDVSVRAGQRLSRRVDLVAGVKLPTGNANNLIGSGGVDAGMAFQYRQALRGKWRFYGMAGFVAQSPGKSLQSVRGLVHQEAMALTWQPNSRDNWVAQWQSEASPVQTGVSGSDSSQRLITFGYQRKVRPGQMLELSFSEDRDVFNGRWPEGANIGPDFTAHVGYVVRR